jgi:hypothetical protein
MRWPTTKHPERDRRSREHRWRAPAVEPGTPRFLNTVTLHVFVGRSSTSRRFPPFTESTGAHRVGFARVDLGFGDVLERGVPHEADARLLPAFFR